MRIQLQQPVKLGRKVLYFLGRKTSLWLLVGILSGALMGLSELAVSVLLQSLLVSLGVIQDELSVLNEQLVFLLSSPTILLASLLVIILVRGFTHFLVSQSASVAHELINARLRCVAIYDLLHNKDFVSASGVNAKIGDTFPKAAQFAQNAATGIPNLIQCVILLVCMFFIAWKEASIALIMISGVAAIVWRVNHHVRRAASQIPKEQKALIRGIERITRNWLLVKILRTARLEGSRLNKNIQNYSRYFIRSRLLGNAASSLPIILGGFVLVSIVALNLLVFNTSGPILLAFLYLLLRFTQQLAGLAKSLGMCSSLFNHFRLAGQYFFKFSPEQLDAALHPDKLRAHETSIATQQSTSLDNEKAPRIEIDRLWFRYGKDSNWVLRDFSLVIPEGSQFGVVGRSGSGKSTLLALVLGVLEPTKGQIRIDGKSPQDYFSQGHIRVGYVGAEPFLIEGSVRENLSYGSSKQHSDEEFWEALRFARLHESIGEKRAGLDFRLKENGEGLSAGQKQRLALARAFLARPQILVLDEASANLDEQTEQEITESIQSRNKQWTVMIVSHRAGILTLSEQVFDFDQPRPSGEFQSIRSL